MAHRKGEIILNKDTGYFIWETMFVRLTFLYQIRFIKFRVTIELKINGFYIKHVDISDTVDILNQESVWFFSCKNCHFIK